MFGLAYSRSTDNLAVNNNSQRFKKLLMAVLAAVLLSGFSTVLAKEGQGGLAIPSSNQINISMNSAYTATVGKNGVLKVGIFQNKPVVFSEDGQAKGLFVDVLDHIAEKERWDIEYVTVNLKDYLADPEASSVDIMTCLGCNVERQKKLAYSKTPMWTFWGTVYSNDIKIQSVLDLQDRKVGVRRSNKITTDLKKLLTGFEVTPNYVEFDDYESAFVALSGRQIDALAVNNTYAFTASKVNNVHKTPIVFSPFPAYFTMPKSRENRQLLDIIDTYVTALKNDRDSVYYHSLDKHGLGSTPGHWDTKKIILFLAVVVIVTVLIMGLWRYRSIVVINENLKKSIERRQLAEHETQASNLKLRANERQLEKLLKRLEYTNKELQDIVYTTSHDLKSPLVNIQGFAGELQTDCDNLIKMLAEQSPENTRQIEQLLKEDIPQSLGFITGSTRKMASLLDGLLQVSRVGKIKFKSVTVDANKILKDVLGSLNYQINEHDIDVKAQTLPTCIGDPNMINTVFANLLGNAIKYRDTARKTEITIAGKVEENMSIYCVQDNGIGIDPAHQKKVFEVFHRLNPSDHVEGEGLGLTIVTRIMDRLGGRIWLESEEGTGSKFYFALPTV